MSDNLNTIWKKSLEPVPSHTTLSLVSLYDLLYDSNGVPYSTNSTKAFKLPHDIICYNTGLYKGASGTIQGSGNADWPADFVSNGIDISIPEYDKRANLRFVKCDITYGESNSYVFENSKDGPGFYIKEKDAALAPSNITEFIERGVKINPDIAPMDNTYGYTSVEPSSLNATADILLTNEDTSFKGTLVTTTGLGCYNNIFLNTSSLNVKEDEHNSFLLKLIVKAFNFSNTNSLVTNDGTLDYLTGNINGEKWSKLYNKLTSIQYGPDYPDYSFLGDDNLFVFLCKNTFVWLRCPFFGDYINPDSFMQDLNTESKVKFSEIILGKEQDLRMFDETIRGKESDKTETYVPRVSPTIDLISKKYISGDNGIAGNNSIIKEEETADEIDKFLDDNIHTGNPKFKGIVTSPVNRETTAELTPPNYFNKESRRDGEYYKELRKFPTVLDNDGNAYITGRVISPTIDEIWTMLKKLVSGRVADEAADTAIKDSYSIPLGTANRENKNNTTLSEVQDSDYFIDNKYMDPLDYEIEPVSIEGIEGENLTLRVTNYVNQNDSIVYKLFDKLRDLSDNTIQHDEANDENHKIDKCVSVDENTAISDDVFGPRKVPFSLREIEALIKGNRYNIEALATYLKYNYGAVGKLGLTTNPQIKEVDEEGNETSYTDETNVAAGSLFQFHKDYNYDFTEEFPSTVFNKNADTDGKGKAAVFDDESRTDVAKYGTAASLPKKSNDYSSADVYLAADGTWRYIFDHVRLPILSEEF